MGRIFEKRKHSIFKTAAQNSKLYSKYSKQLYMAAKNGVPDPEANPVLRAFVEKAKRDNVPSHVIEKAIQKAAGTGGEDFQPVRYEGFGPGGALIIVDCLTDNKVRTVAEVRHAFSKFGGNMGSDGCVAFQFKHCGQMIFAPGTDEAALMDAAIEAGADDVTSNDDGSIEVLTPPNDYMAVKDALEAAGFKPEFGEVTMKPEGENVFAGDEGVRMQKLLDALENLDDVQEIYTTAVIED